MKLVCTIFLLSILSCSAFCRNESRTIAISDDLQLIKLSENAYIHISYHQSEQFGRFPSNGMIIVDESKAWLLDTPMTDSLTRTLISYIQDSMKIEIVGFLTCDWHPDSQGGLNVVQKYGIPSYSSELTREIAASKKLPVAENGFKNLHTLKIGEKELICKFHGAAHTMDNIVVWIPSEKILFADCLVKEVRARNLGFTGDGDLKEYATTLKKIKKSYPDAQIVVPGHGAYGGMELIDHTLQLAKQIREE